MALSHKAKGPLTMDPSIISAFLPMYMGPVEALSMACSIFAPFSMKIFSLPVILFVELMGADFPDLVINL